MRGRAGQARRGARGVREVGGPRDGDRRRSPTRAGCACCAGGEVVGDMPVEALVDDCPLYDLEPGRAARADLPARRRRSSTASESPEETLLALLGSPNIASKRWAFEQYDSLVGSRTDAPARGGRRRGAHARARRRQRRDRGVDRRQRPPRGLRPVHAAPSRRCSSARATSPASERSRSASRTASTSATRRSRTSPGSYARRRRAARRLPRARRAGRGRQRLALQRGRRRPDLPHAGRRHGRQAARPGDACRGARFREPGHAIALVGPFAPSLAGSELEKLRGAARRRSCRAVDLAAQAAALDAIRDAVRSGVRRDRPRRLRGRARRVRSPSAAIAGGIGATGRARASGLPDAVRRGPGRSRRSRGRASASTELEEIPATARSSGHRRDRRETG